MKNDQLVERAFEAMRGDARVPEADPALEARLRAHHRPAPVARLRRVTLVLAAIGLTGAAVAAGGGARWIQGWFFAVDVEGERLSGVIEEGTTTTIPFATANGDSGTVQVRRDQLANGAVRTRIDIDRDGVGRVDRESFESSTGEDERFAIDELDDAVLLYGHEDALCEVYATSSALTGSRILLLDDDGSELPVLELATLPFDLLASGSRAEITELDGSLNLSFDDGRGRAVEFHWSKRAALPGEDARLQLPDGSVRVRLDGDH